MGTRETGTRGAVQMPTSPLDDLPTSERGGANYSMQGGTRPGWVLQLNTATKIRHVENGGAFKEMGRRWGSRGGFHAEVRVKEV